MSGVTLNTACLGSRLAMFRIWTLSSLGHDGAIFCSKDVGDEALFRDIPRFSRNNLVPE